MLFVALSHRPRLRCTLRPRAVDVAHRCVCVCIPVSVSQMYAPSIHISVPCDGSHSAHLPYPPSINYVYSAIERPPH